MEFERSWCNLSAKPLNIINIKLFGNNLLRSVCRRWGEEIPPPSVNLDRVLPLPLNFYEFESEASAILLVPATVCLFRNPNCTSSPWWLVFVEQSSVGAPLRLFHPLTRERFPMEEFPEVRGDVVCISVANRCTLRYNENDNGDDSNIITEKKKKENDAVIKLFHEQFCVSKVLLWRDPAFSNFSLVKLHTQGTVLECFRIPYWMNNNGGYNIKICIKISLGDEPLRIDDIEVWNGLLWAIDCQGELYGISYQKLKATIVTRGGLSETETSGSGAKRLVVARGLFLVVCNNNKQGFDEFSIYMFDEIKLKWEKISTLGDRILFVGYDTCFVHRTRALTEFPGSSIVYPKNLYPHFSDQTPRDGFDYIGIKDFLELRLSVYGVGANHVLISDHPHLSAVFWPPPNSIFKNFSFPESKAGTSGTEIIANEGSNHYQFEQQISTNLAMKKMKSILVYQRSWHNLSAKPLIIINSKLYNKFLRSVCRRWGEEIPPPLVELHTLLPLTLFLHEKNSIENIRIPAIHLLPTAVYLLRRRYSHNTPWWLVSVEQSSSSSPLRLFHPLTRARVPMKFLSELYKDLDYIRITEGCTMRYKKIDNGDREDDNGNNNDRKENKNDAVFKHLPEQFCVSKVLLWRDPTLHNYTVVKLHTHGSVLECFRLPYWAHQEAYNFKNCVKISLQSDAPLANRGFKSLPIDDIELWNGMLWAVDTQGKLFGVSYETLKVRVVVDGGISATSGSGAKRLLVDDDNNGLCLVVCNNNHHCNEFTVYSFDFRNLSWIKMSNIGQTTVLFVGYDTCFSISTRYLVGFPGNCIVYPKNLYPYFSDKKPRDEAEDHAKDYLDLQLYIYGSGGNCMLISQHQNLSAVFWPPPVLIKNLPFQIPEAKAGGNSTSVYSNIVDGIKAVELSS